MKNKKPRTVTRDRLVGFLDNELKINAVQDVSRNGLQVEGAETVRRVGLAVDACEEAYATAAEKGCQMVIAHHGMIWGGLAHLTKIVGRQIKFLFDHGISLYAAHLPLDLHPKYGNNARIADILRIRSRKPFGEYKGIFVGCEGALPRAASVWELSDRLEQALGGKNAVLPFGKKKIQRVGIMSGRATDTLAEAIDKGLDCFVTGETRHEHYHMAKEAGINAVYCGHYYSEKVGVQAVGELVRRKFGIESVFIDIPTTM